MPHSPQLRDDRNRIFGSELPLMYTVAPTFGTLGHSGCVSLADRGATLGSRSQIFIKYWKHTYPASQWVLIYSSITEAFPNAQHKPIKLEYQDAKVVSAPGGVEEGWSLILPGHR